MVRKGIGRRFALGLMVALLINVTLIALIVLERRDAAWVSTTETNSGLKLQLTREQPESFKTEPAKSRDGQAALFDRRSAPPLASPQVRSIAKTSPETPGAQPAVSAPTSEQGVKTGARQGDSAADADLRARTALALRRLGACSRLNSGIGDSQDKALCSRDFAAADGATIDTIPAGKRSDYDAAHARAGYLVPADAANPDFVVSQFKRGSTVVTGHAGCSLVGGKWTCVGH